MAEFWHYKGTGNVLIFSYVNSARATYLKFIKENDLKYKGNINFLVFPFFWHEKDLLSYFNVSGWVAEIWDLSTFDFFGRILDAKLLSKLLK